MGDISRHRDIYLNTRDAIPTSLLDKCKLRVGDLTYLEMGNFLTDVSQFRDPVFYIFAKQRIWREFVIPKAADKANTARIVAALAGAAGLAASQVLKGMTSGVTSEIAKYAGPALAGIGGVLAVLPTDTYAGIVGADDWIDQMFGTPIERIGGDPKKRDEKHYGYVGQFFKYFMEGITHLLFADEIGHKVGGQWGKIDKLPESSVSAVFRDFFTQYYPHEHTDQPPYVWDASKRPNHPNMYGPSKRQHNLIDTNIGVMNAVDKHYIQYLSEGLADLEHDWRKIMPDDHEARRRMLVRMGKLLHGIEDWYFHSNVVELLRLRSHKPAKGEAQDPNENDEEFLQRFVRETAEKDPEFRNANPAEKVRLQRRLYRRLRSPVFSPGNKIQSGGILSKTASRLSLHHAYPAFPSQQDTANTLLHALENLERKVTHPTPSGDFDVLSVAPCLIEKLAAVPGGEGQKLLEEKAKARGVDKAVVEAALSPGGAIQRDEIKVVFVDVMREWLPLVVTLLSESERQRLVADVDPLQWPIPGDETTRPKGDPTKSIQLDQQVKWHKKALEPKESDNGVKENNYERAIRYLADCGFLNAQGQKALVTAFEIDQKSQKLLADAPGSGGFLIQFAVDLQRILGEGETIVEKLNKDKDSILDQASDNGVFSEIIGSHSLMSKDTLESPPFFDDAKVLASVASSSVFHIMLEQVSAPASDRRLPWKAILYHLIRYPVKAGGWERRSIDFFRKNGRIPRYADLPELARLVESALRSSSALEPWRKGTKVDDLQALYTKLEIELSNYRYP